MWLFSLMAHDGLTNMRPEQWGTPLVFSLLYLVGFATYECYKDFKEYRDWLIKEEMEEQEEDGLKAEEEQDGFGDGDGDDEAESEDHAPASTEDAGAGADAPADEEGAEDSQDAPTQLDLAIDMVLCNTSAEAALTSVPPPPKTDDQALIF